MPRRNILLVDLPSYSIPIPSPYRELLDHRLRAQTVISNRRIGFALTRPGLPYSRGLLLLAAYLELQGHYVQYLVYPDPADAQRFIDLCKNADVIGFTAMTPVVQQAYTLCKQAKIINPAALCVLGGPHANAMQAQCLEECPELDIVIPGAGEMPFSQLVKSLSSYQDVRGIIYRQAKQAFIYNPNQHNEQFITPIEMPGPAYHLLNRPLSEYAHNIRTFLGCPYKCDFCIERLSWRGKKGRNNLRRVIDEIRLVSQKSPSHTLIHFSDSVFTLDEERTLELCYLLTQANLDVVFSCDTRIDHVNTKIVKALAEARFVCIRLGIENLDDTILQKANKGIAANQSLETLHLIRSAAPHMMIHAYMLTGLPGSTTETLIQAAQSIRTLILSEQVDVIGNKVLVPYPGTPYFTAPERYGVEILHHNWSGFDRLSLPVYRLQDLTEYQIYFGFLTLESVLQQAYELRIGDSHYINQATPQSLDYVYRNYVQQIGPRLGTGTLLMGSEMLSPIPKNTI